MRMSIVIIAIAAVLILVCTGVFGQEDVSGFDRPFFLGISPGVSIPIGVDSSVIRTGGIVSLSAEFVPARFPVLGLSAELGFSINPYSADSAISTITGGGGVSRPAYRWFDGILGSRKLFALPTSGARLTPAEASQASARWPAATAALSAGRDGRPASPIARGTSCASRSGCPRPLPT